MIAILRKKTAATIAQIRAAIIHKLPLEIGVLFGRNHDEVESRALSLIHDLDQLGAAFEILLDDRVELRSYFNNRLQSRRQSLVETRMITNLELGEPDIETLEWLKNGDPRVFRITIEQIAAGDGFNVDSETLDWVKRQLDSTDAST